MGQTPEEMLTELELLVKHTPTGEIATRFLNWCQDKLEQKDIRFIPKEITLEDLKFVESVYFCNKCDLVPIHKCFPCDSTEREDGKSGHYKLKTQSNGQSN